ncbi:MAG: penicillin acylase family protein [Armatimonadetes bacterium]|nr:penicillin acylase family protein [Armatimonadota bacterium]
MRRLLRVLLLLVLVAVLALGAGSAYLIRRPFPQISGTATVAGLKAPVEVIRDRWGIPHIYAQNPHDLFFAQGYVHAQDRLWQMDLSRRLAAGRLSEIFGPVALEADRLMRVLGLRRAAEAAWAAAASAAGAPEAAAAIEAVQAYSAGVNAFIESRRDRLPLEFLLLRFQPEPWTPVDSLSFGKLMAWVLGGTWRTELLRAGLAIRFGDEGMRTLFPTQVPGTPTITAGGIPSIALPPGLPFASLLAGSPGAGSNNWVVAPSRSTSGALLANDIHLDVQMPSIWYENHLVGGPYDVIGASFPGVPSVVAGHNRHIAWGLTNVNPDVQDLYVERFHPRDPDRYFYQGQWVRATVVREEIRIKGRPEPEVVVVRVTRHGPVLNPAVRGLGAFMALRWTAHDPDRILQAVLALDRAANWAEFREALREWSVPSQNFVFADRTGNIGFIAPGRIPIRPPGVDGRLPVPGWTGTFEWQGYIPHEELPTLFNPPGGVIVTANNRVAPPSYPYHLGEDFDVGFRALRITSRLEETARLSLDDFAAIQQDVTSLPARRFVAAWQDVRIDDADRAALFNEVKQWDGQVTAESRPALLYEVLLLRLAHVVFKDALDQDLFRRYLRQGDAPLLVLLEMSGRPDDPWWGEGRDRVIEQALRQTVRELEAALGDDRSAWRWGRIHTPTLLHPLGRQRGLGWIFNAVPPEMGGDGFTVNAAGFDPEEPYRTAVAPSYRQLIDTKDWSSARAIHPTGQSGLPFSRHYRDFVAMWAKGDYHPLLFTRDAILAAQEGTLRLLPP